MAIGPHSRAWTTTLTKPAGGDLASDLDTLGQQITRDVDERVKAEHYMGQSTSQDGQHYENAARAGFGLLANRPPDPSVTPQVGARDSLNQPPAAYIPADGGNEGGRIYLTTNAAAAEFYWSDGADWRTIEALRGDAATNRIDLLAGVQFLIAGADAMDIHAHQARHSSVGGADKITNLINDVDFGFTAGPTAVAAADVTLHQELAFLPFNARGAGTSHAIILGWTGANAMGIGGSTTWEFFLRDTTIGADIGQRVHLNTHVNITTSPPIFVAAYYTGITHVDHDVELRMSRTGGGGMTYNARNSSLLLIDLGVE